MCFQGLLHRSCLVGNSFINSCPPPHEQPEQFNRTPDTTLFGANLGTGTAKLTSCVPVLVAVAVVFSKLAGFHPSTCSKLTMCSAQWPSSATFVHCHRAKQCWAPLWTSSAGIKRWDFHEYPPLARHLNKRIDGFDMS